MYIYLKHFIVWPGCEEVLKTMPDSFKREFNRYTCIIALRFFVSALATRWLELKRTQIISTTIRSNF